MSKAKRNALLLLSFAGVWVIILAMALPNLTLSPGQPFSIDPSQARSFQFGSLFADGRVLLWIFRGVLALLLVLFVIYVIYSLMTPEGRKRLIANIIMLVVLFFIADYLRNNLPPPVEQEGQTVEMMPPMDQMGEGQAVSVFPENPPEWLTFTVVFAISVFVFVMLAVIAWFWMRRRNAPKSALEQLSEEAQQAIEALHSGGDFRMTIIRCYQEMSQVLKAEKGIARDATMTPREFEDQLVRRGFPAESIRTLTRLFEQVRYGSKQADTGEEGLALACLTDIVDACKAIGAR
jgi:hypothetical protein